MLYKLTVINIVRVVSSIALNKTESIIGGCSSSSVVIFDTVTSNPFQEISIPFQTIAIMSDTFITGSTDGTIGLLSFYNKSDRNWF